MEVTIKEKIREIEEKENVRILFAVESGSRAWGFPSPDSDYDVRFVYVRKKEDYLRLDAYRDVIEWQLDDVLDINGWDLQKTLRLLKNSNPTVFEWLNSPVIYYSTIDLELLKEIAKPYFVSKKGVHHYLHMAQRNNREHLQDDYVKLKKYFYVLRPLLACRWIIDKGTNPPVLFEELMEAESDIFIKSAVEKLLELKKETSELGKGKRIVLLNEYIDREIIALNNLAYTLPDNNDESWESLNDYFIKTVEKYQQ